MVAPLSMWTLYRNPADAPGVYVLRRFEVLGGEVSLTREAYMDGDPERLRSLMRMRGLACLPRSPGDEPHIVETWI